MKDRLGKDKFQSFEVASAATRAANNRAAVRSNYGARNGQKRRRMNAKPDRLTAKVECEGMKTSHQLLILTSV